MHASRDREIEKRATTILDILDNKVQFKILLFGAARNQETMQYYYDLSHAAGNLEVPLSRAA